jgi:hypothetical protein
MLVVDVRFKLIAAAMLAPQRSAGLCQERS